MPKGFYIHKRGNEHHRWKGGFPNCLICGKRLPQHMSPSVLKRGVQQRCQDCFIKERQKKAEKNNRCYKCFSPVSRVGHQCMQCVKEFKKGKHYSIKTEWKAGKIPMSHLRSNFGNKYNISKKEDRTYNGIVYHSKMESIYAAYLDTLKKRKEITNWEGQIPLDVSINGKLISRYFCDFKIYFPDGHFEYHEVKGFSTELYILKKKCIEAIYKIKIIEIKQKQMKTLGIL